MRKFKVVALSVGAGKGKKIYNSGDIVTENNFPAGIADDLVKKKFLKEVTVEETEVLQNDKEAKQPSLDELRKQLMPDFVDDEDKTKPDLDEQIQDIGEKKIQQIVDDLKDGEETKTPSNEPEKTLSIPSIDDVNKKQIVDDLKDAKVEFNQNLSKEILYPMWVSLKTKKV